MHADLARGSGLAVDLSGAWQFRLAGAPKNAAPRPGLRQWMPARVPGTVHYQLQRARKIPDPYGGQNELDLQWIDQQDWEWRRTFRVNPLACSQSRQQLIFDGLDTVATIFLNGQIAGKSVNMFRQVVCDVQGLLKPGENELRVLLASPTAYALKEFARGKKRVPAGDFSWVPGETRLTGRAWIRKTQCHFGWDWGVYLATSGIWQDVRLECSDGPRLAAVTVQQQHLGPVGAPTRVNLHVTAFLESPAPGGGVLHLTCDGREVQTPVRLAQGENHVRAEITIGNPKLWWPNGQGAQPLYSLHVEWRGDNGARTTLHKRLGLRTLELVRQPDRSPDGQPAETFYFRVNGRPVFAQGADWIPADQFVERCTPGLYRHLLTSMAEAHMNMVRIWGGGWYEQDSFYDLCDELGILVWQDFMMACAVYPDTPAFIRELQAEAKYQVRRLQSRPCLALWCGDNEIMAGVWDWWKSSPDFKKNTQIYIKVMSALKKTVAAEDATRSFWLSSPCSGGFGDQPEDFNRGDIHYWRVWHKKEPFSDYLNVKPRFASEFGFQSFPEPRTIRAVVPPDELNPSSRVMEHHQRSLDGNMLITNTIARELPLPKDFDNYCWASQINQAMAIRTAVEHWRRLRPWCMGTLYWQLNDLWPVASWSSIDYHGRWKALHHFATRFFAPLLVSLVHEGGRLTAWATSDSPQPLNLKGSLDIFDWSGALVARRPLSTRLQPGQSRAVDSFSVQKLLRNHSPRDVCVFLRLAGGGLAHENFTTLVPWKWARLPQPKLHGKLRTDSRGIELAVRSPQVIPFLHAELEGLEGHFAGDWQVLRPGTHILRWVPHGHLGAPMPSPAEAHWLLKVWSLYDTFAHE